MGGVVKVEYGPPGQSGVKTLMHVGEEDGPVARNAEIHRVSGTVGMVSVGVWAWAYLADNEQLRKYAFATSVMSFVAKFATRPK
jgi:hypothetical protein